MSSDDTKQITSIRRVAWDGSSCPDGADCPAQATTNYGMHVTVGRPVTDPEVLRNLDLAPGEVAIETPDQLWEEP